MPMGETGEPSGHQQDDGDRKIELPEARVTHSDETKGCLMEKVAREEKTETDEPDDPNGGDKAGRHTAAWTKAISWGDKVRGYSNSKENITEGTPRNTHMLEGVWNPLHKKLLLGTLMADWDDTDSTLWTEDEAAMRQEAMATANASCDESVRVCTQRENTILLTYLRNGLDLPHPPNFVKEILIGEHRAMLEDMHEAHFNSTLTAVVPATVRLARNAAHAIIFRELFNANTDKNSDHTMMRAFQRDVKRLIFDANQTLNVTFYSKAAADRWQGMALRL
ncbi:hypothetical protein KRP22_014335 [Phytophthora ramorum]|nr:hypothetical protein KRP22_9064 [Phytophthora ramorum]